MLDVKMDGSDGVGKDAGGDDGGARVVFCMGEQWQWQRKVKGYRGE